MLGTAEWDRYAYQRRPLRLSRPRGYQRSTFYLTLPYHYGVPNLIFFILIHWMISESFFFINIQGYNVQNVKIKSTTKRGSCFSALPTFVTLLLMLVAWIALTSLGLKKFKTQAPLVTHCSAAIRASCHPPPDDADAAFKPIMWGEVSRQEDAPAEGEWIDCDLSGQAELPTDSEPGLGARTYEIRYANCSLTSKEVQTPEFDRLYC